jgi:hypothetical protein
MTKQKQKDQFSEQEAARRRDAVTKHMIDTPPKPHSEMKIGKRKRGSNKKSTHDCNFLPKRMINPTKMTKIIKTIILISFFSSAVFTTFSR